MKKYLLIPMMGLTTVANALTTPNIVINCRDKVVEPCDSKTDLSITNKGETQVTSLNITCVDKDNPIGTTYTFKSSLNLDPLEVQCLNVRDNCAKTSGIFVKNNVTINIVSSDYDPPFVMTKTCTWKK